jgi:hypothetical protein
MEEEWDGRDLGLRHGRAGIWVSWYPDDLVLILFWHSGPAREKSGTLSTV